MADFEQVLRQMQALKQEEDELRDRRIVISSRLEELEEQVKELQGQKVAVDNGLALLNARKQSVAAAVTGCNVGKVVSTTETVKPAAEAPPTAQTIRQDQDIYCSHLSASTVEEKSKHSLALTPKASDRPQRVRYQTASSNDVSAFESCDRYVREDEGCIHPLFPTVVFIDGDWVEVICRYCNGNSHKKHGVASGMNGLHLHFVKAHKTPKNRHYPFHKERPISMRDVDLMAKGENPLTPIVARLYASNNTSERSSTTTTAATNTSEFTAPSTYVGKDNGHIHELFPSVVSINGRWVEVICRACGGNHSSKRGFVKGIQGLINHSYGHGVGHSEAIHKERPVSNKDVQRMLQGKEPEETIVARAFCQI